MTLHIIKTTAKIFNLSAILFILSLSSLHAKNYTSRLNVGVSLGYININDKTYNYANKYELIKNPRDQLKSFSLGYSAFFKNNVNISLSTNRLTTAKYDRTVTRKSDGVSFLNKSTTKIDSLILSYRIKRFNTGLILANVKMNKYLFYNNARVGSTKKTAILGGINLGYFVNKNIVTSLSFIIPNQELELESATLFNINYLF